MTRTEKTGTNALPPIVIPAADYTRLAALTENADPRLAQVSEYLARELQRAEIVDDAAFAAHVVRIGSRVTYREGADGRQRTVQLVWPHEANVDLQRISVMSVVGAALVGMAPGSTIEWPSPVGGTRQLTVVAIHDGPAPGAPDAAA